MSRIWTIARRDVKALFDQPTGYVLLIVFLAVNAFLFFRNAYIMNVASLRPMLDMLPWIFLFFVPAVAMRTIAEDNRGGVLEVVLAQPLSEAELLLGKYLGSVIVLLIALAVTLPIPLGLTLGSRLPWGPVVAQYAGAGLLAAAFAGIGVWASSLGKSQITAFILSVAVMFVLILVGLDPLLVGLGPTLGGIAARLGVLSHFQSMSRGVLALRDVLYFLSVAAIFLVLAYAVLMRRRLAPGSAATRQLRLGTVLLAAVVIGLNLAGGEIGGRLDLTPGHAYTLSPATRKIARAAPDIVTITLYASTALPEQFTLNERDVRDLLHDLKSASGGKVRVLERDPASDSAAARDAQALGIVPVQFNVVGQSSLQVKEGYFGLVVQYADKHRTIPFVRETNDLEYTLASDIQEMTRTRRPVVALLADSAAGSYADFRQELEKNYTVETPDLSDSAATLDSVSTLVIASGLDTVPAAEQLKVAAWLAKGGKALFLASGMVVIPQVPFARQRKLDWNAVLEPYGVRVGHDMVYDLRANQLVGVPTSFGQVFRPYPFFLRAVSTRASPVDADLSEISLPWTSSVDTLASKTCVAVPLLVTTTAAGDEAGEAMINPDQNYATTNLARRILAVGVTPKKGRTGPRLVVVGDAMAANDMVVERSPANLAFALNAVDWLTQQNGLIEIRAKNRLPPPLLFSSNALRDAVKYANLIVLPVLVAAWGLVRLVKRRRLAAIPYRREADA